MSRAKVIQKRNEIGKKKNIWKRKITQFFSFIVSTLKGENFQWLWKWWHLEVSGSCRNSQFLDFPSQIGGIRITQKSNLSLSFEHNRNLPMGVSFAKKNTISNLSKTSILVSYIWARLVARKSAEIRKWGNIITHFPIYPNTGKRKIRKFLFLFSFTQPFSHFQNATVNFVVM